MLKAVTILLIFQLVGEVGVRALTLPLPGPVLGMLLLFAGLTLRGSAPVALTRVAHGLLDHLSLLYVPAGVGIMVQLARLRHEWLALLLTLILSTTLTVLITALVLRWLIRWLGAASQLGER